MASWGEGHESIWHHEGVCYHEREGHESVWHHEEEGYESVCHNAGEGHVKVGTVMVTDDIVLAMVQG